jgi:hypothetical protein
MAETPECRMNDMIMFYSWFEIDENTRASMTKVVGASGVVLL